MQNTTGINVPHIISGYAFHLQRYEILFNFTRSIIRLIVLCRTLKEKIMKKEFYRMQKHDKTLFV